MCASVRDNWSRTLHKFLVSLANINEPNVWCHKYQLELNGDQYVWLRVCINTYICNASTKNTNKNTNDDDDNDYYMFGKIQFLKSSLAPRTNTHTHISRNICCDNNNNNNCNRFCCSKYYFHSFIHVIYVDSNKIIRYRNRMHVCVCEKEGNVKWNQEWKYFDT